MGSVKNVLVVGGGIGGQSAAIGFAKSGVAVEIIEILEIYNVYGVGIIQQGNALRALDQLGIADEAMRRGSPYHRSSYSPQVVTTSPKQAHPQWGNSQVTTAFPEKPCMKSCMRRRKN